MTFLPGVTHGEPDTNQLAGLKLQEILSDNQSWIDCSYLCGYYLCCFCNVFKGAQQNGVDSLTGEGVPLFHHVRQRWHDHFTWDESKTHIIGLTASGRATVVALRMNNPTVVRARHRWVRAGWHPPEM